MASHVQIARTKGPAAGLRAYLGTLSKFSEGTAQANTLDELLALSREDRWNFYCEKFLNGKDESVAKSRGNTREEALASALADLDDDDNGVQVVADDNEPGIIGALRRSYRSNTGTRRSGKGTSAFGVGTRFVYQGKNAKTTHEVVGEGKTKHGRKAWLCKNPKGNVKAWNKKSVALYIERGTITVK